MLCWPTWSRIPTFESVLNGPLASGRNFLTGAAMLREELGAGRLGYGRENDGNERADV